MSDDILVLVFI